MAPCRVGASYISHVVERKYSLTLLQLCLLQRIERDGQISTYDKVITAVQQGSLLATAFHPELTADTRWHSLFVDLVQRSKLGPVSIKEEAPVLLQTEKPADLPVFSQPIA